MAVGVGVGVGFTVGVGVGVGFTVGVGGIGLAFGDIGGDFGVGIVPDDWFSGVGF